MNEIWVIISLWGVYLSEFQNIGQRELVFCHGLGLHKIKVDQTEVFFWQVGMKLTFCWFLPSPMMRDRILAGENLSSGSITKMLMLKTKSKRYLKSFQKLNWNLSHVNQFTPQISAWRGCRFHSRHGGCLVSSLTVESFQKEILSRSTRRKPLHRTFLNKYAFPLAYISSTSTQILSNRWFR